MKEKDNYRWIFNIGFFIYALYGFVTLGNYGIPLDEQTQRVIGVLNAKFVSGRADAAGVIDNGFFGPAYEILCHGLEQIIYTSSFGSKLLLRHAILFVFFLLAIRCFYAIARSLAKKGISALLATLLFATYPLLFAHAHYNSKDTFFLCMLLFVFFFLNQYLIGRKWKYLITAAILLGIATTIRMNGLFLMAAVLPAIAFSGNWDKKIYIKSALIFLIVMAISYVLFYPYLWLTGVRGLANIFGYVSQNPWPWDTLVAGQVARSGELPWWYLSSWIFVTVPVCILLFFLVGFFVFFKDKKWSVSALSQSFFLVLVLPFLYFMIARPTIYDGWRHMQFLIVPIAIFTIYAFDFLENLVRKRMFSVVLTVYTVGNFIFWQPFGYAYFNEIYALTNKGNTYEQDYWGLSALPSLQWLSEHQRDGEIKIYCFLESGQLNRNLLQKITQDRMYFQRQKDSADYEIEFRRSRYFDPPKGEVIYHIRPLKDTLVRVVKLRKNQKL